MWGQPTLDSKTTKKPRSTSQNQSNSIKKKPFPTAGWATAITRLEILKLPLAATLGLTKSVAIKCIRKKEIGWKLSLILKRVSLVNCLTE